MLKRLNYTNNFVVRSDKHCTILKLQLGGTLKQTLVNAQHSLHVSCIFESTKIDMLFVCMLRSRQLSYEPVSFPLSLYFSYLDAPLPANPPRFSFTRAPRLSLSLFLPSTLLQALPFLHDRFHSYLYSVFYFLSHWFAPTFHPFIPFLTRTSVYTATFLPSCLSHHSLRPLPLPLCHFFSSPLYHFYPSPLKPIF